MELYLENSVCKALINDIDYNLVKYYKWYLGNRGYIYTTEWDSTLKKNRHILLHRLIMGFPDCIVDHWDRNRLNNQRDNLRLVSSLESSWNRDVTKRSKTGYRGVYYEKRTNKYYADIMVQGERIPLGYFYNKEDAAKARDVAAIQYYGEYACLNFADFDYTSYIPYPDMKQPTSKYKGINFDKRNNKWSARIQRNGKRIFLGYFDTEDEAIAARQKEETSE